MTAEELPRPYPPSWVDRFISWMEAMPGPYWLALLVLFLLLGGQNQLVFWISGQNPWGVIDPQLFLYQLFTVEVLYFMNYLDRDASRALRAFRSLINVSEEEMGQLQYKFTHLPSRPVLGLTAFGILVGAYYSYSVEQFYSDSYSLNLQTIYGVIGFAIPMILALVFCYRIVSQLRMVNRLYASAVELDLFNLDPVYALSTHTAKAGLIFLFLIYSNSVIAPGSIQVPTALIATIVISILSFAAFVLPLVGVNRRLVAEKKSMLQGVNARLKEAFTRLERDFDNRVMEDMQGLQQAITNLERQRSFIEKIPTWPWQPSTMRGFVSAMLLPILIWVVQQVLERILVF